MYSKPTVLSRLENFEFVIKDQTVSFVLRLLVRILDLEMIGLAISGIRIEGLESGVSKVRNLEEDLMDLAFNLQSVVFKGAVVLERPVIAKLHYQGPGVIRAKHIQLPPGIEVVDSSVYIAKVTSNQVFAMDILIKNVQGCSLAFSTGLDSMGFMPIDASYMPVVRFNFSTELQSEITSGMDPKESFKNGGILKINMLTNGSIGYVEAMRLGYAKLRAIFGCFADSTSHGLRRIAKRRQKRRRRTASKSLNFRNKKM